MCGKALFCDFVHFKGPDLHFERRVFWSPHRGVQRLITVRFWFRNVIVEGSFDHRPEAVHNSQCVIAVAGVVGDYAQRDEVMDFVEGPAQFFVAFLFAGDAEEMLGSTAYRCIDAGVFDYCFLQPRHSERCVLLPFTAFPLHQPRDRSVLAVVKVVERAVFESPLPIVHPQPVSEGRVYVHRLARDSFLLLLGHVAQRLDVVHSIGEFYQQHSPVLARRDQHFAEALDASLLTICPMATRATSEGTAVDRVQFDLFKFRNAID